ncbi:MAG: FAD-dependent oxidoreductase [Treponema sp.]|nr:FAD-dependent oxidoreductase [Treponema sp.]
MSCFDADLIIIGAGPAGLAAAQYGAMANLKVLVLEQLSCGGQALVIDVLENYPGNAGQFDADGKMISSPRSGYEVAMDMYRQAQGFGAVFSTFYAKSMKKEDDVFIINFSDDKPLKAKAVIIATGSKPRLLDIPGEKEFSGKGVSYCAVCDGNFFKGKKIIVAGGGDAACEEAMYLSRLSDNITIVHRRDSFRAQKTLVQRIMNNPNIKVRFNTVIKEIKGGKKVNSVVLSGTKDGGISEEQADAVFICSGTVPQTGLAFSLNVELDENGYIVTDRNLATNIAGFFAAGDVRSGAFRQVVTAAADGAVAAHSAAEYIDSLTS